MGPQRVLLGARPHDVQFGPWQVSQVACSDGQSQLPSHVFPRQVPSQVEPLLGGISGNGSDSYAATVPVRPANRVVANDSTWIDSSFIRCIIISRCA